MITIDDKINIITNRLADLERSISHFLNMDEETTDWYNNSNEEIKNKINTFVNDQNFKTSKLNDILNDLKNGIDES